MLQITISEYGYIGCDNRSTSSDKFVGKRDLEAHEFQELYDFWLSDESTQKLLTFVNKKCLKATSYVGVIQTKNLSLEILPKTYNGSEIESTRTVFIEMLKVTLGMNEIVLNRANLSTTKSKNIYELFITLFVEAMDNLIHKGLKSEYVSQEGNQHFLKGKLKFNEHIRINSIHKERFYVEYDEYLQDRVENRLLKSTLQLLLKKSRDTYNRKALRQQLFIFDEVGFSLNYKLDFSKVNTHRGMEHYSFPLRFTKVFLLNESFTSLRGKEDVFALLFPMQTLFEKYMEFVLENSKEKLGIKEVLVNGGKNEYFLSSKDGCKMARLEPDYLLKMKDGKDIVTDAKWKILEEKEDKKRDCNKVSIASNDVYQIFSYLNFYDCENTALLFVPKVEIEEETELSYQFDKDKETNKKIRVIPIELSKVILDGHRILNLF
jgi:5-methylcytosine-specific restriction enzyme subunit McrC